MANRLRRLQAWLESTLTRAKSKELDVRHNPGLGVSNDVGLEISQNTGIELSSKTSLETDKNTGVEANNNMGHDISNEPGLDISNKSGDYPLSDTSSQQEPPPSNDTSSQQEPPPYCQHSGLRMLPKPIMPTKEDTPSIIRATVGIAAAESGPLAAGRVAAVIDTVAHCVASVPAADAQVTANVVTNSVADYATDLETEPGLSFTTIFEQARDLVPASSKLRLSESFPEVLVNVRYALSDIETWAPNGNLAPAIIYAVAQVANSVAMLSESRIGENIAEIWSDAAHRAVRIVSEGVTTTSSGTRAFLDSPGGDRSGCDRSGGKLSNTNPGTGGCEAVLQTAKLRAAIGALRNYGENAHVLVALNALDAVAAGDRLSYTSEEGLGGVTRCTCNRNLGSCKALLQAARLRAALYALWTYNTNIGNHEIVSGLVAVAAAAGLSTPPENPDGF
jgi:hypothetical protein